MCNKICRCCLTEGCSDIMDYTDGKKKNYENILLETFNVHIPKLTTMKKFICDTCVLKLKEASKFKQQVQRCQESLQTMVLNEEIDSHLEDVKKEIHDLPINDLGTELPNRQSKKNIIYNEGKTTLEQKKINTKRKTLSEESLEKTNRTPINVPKRLKALDLEQNNSDNDSELITQSDVTSEQQTKTKQLATLRSLIRNKIGSNKDTKPDITEVVLEKRKLNIALRRASPLRNEEMVISDPEQTESELSEVALETLNTDCKRFSERSVRNKVVLNNDTKTVSKSKDTVKNNETKPDSILITRQNTLKLIKNSNLCLFRSFRIHLGCYQCKERFLNAKELREHVQKVHKTINKIEASIPKLRGLSCLKAEISNLECKICGQNIKDLTHLQSHLSEHDIKFDSQKHYLVPYQLLDGTNCCICHEKFHKFYSLKIHMNSHLANHVCHICGMSYVDLKSLKAHVKGQHSEQKCPECHLVFPGFAAKIHHLNKVHMKKDALRYCLYCDQTFRHTYKLEKHYVEEHGAKKETFVCSKCGKTLLSRQNLRIHMRSIHNRERRFGCDVCDMRFFTKLDLTRHSATHGDAKLPCPKCEGHFKHKESLRKHMRRAHSSKA